MNQTEIRYICITSSKAFTLICVEARALILYRLSLCISCPRMYCGSSTRLKVCSPLPSRVRESVADTVKGSGINMLTCTFTNILNKSVSLYEQMSNEYGDR
jgi:hypothetical protein